MWNLSFLLFRTRYSFNATYFIYCARCIDHDYIVHIVCSVFTLQYVIFSTGELFAACPVEEFPGIAVQPVSDSSRYFVIRLKDSGSKDMHMRILVYS